MRRIFVPALMAALMTAFCSTDASAFGLLDGLCGKNACDTCCDVEPACGCEVAAPMCGCEVAAPACGCEVAAPCGCDAPCGPKKLGLLSKLFHKHHGCDDCCAAAPTCGLEPACGCEVAAPVCGCEVVDPCGCDAPCRGPSCGQKVKAFFGKLFHKHHGCDDCCAAPSCGIEPACGCEVAAPTCGCEPTCGF